MENFQACRTFQAADSVCLLDAFFAETCALGRTLAGLELGVALADDVQGALALDDSGSLRGASSWTGGMRELS